MKGKALHLQVALAILVLAVPHCLMAPVQAKPENNNRALAPNSNARTNGAAKSSCCLAPTNKCIQVSDFATDPNNCGACNNVCPPTQPTCVGGSCKCTANTQTDRTNCGACGNVCPTSGDAGSYCTYGVCCSAPPIAGGSFLTDPNNCGGCGVRCNSYSTVADLGTEHSAYHECSGGTCQPCADSSFAPSGSTKWQTGKRGRFSSGKGIVYSPRIQPSQADLYNSQKDLWNTQAVVDLCAQAFDTWTIAHGPLPCFQIEVQTLGGTYGDGPVYAICNLLDHALGFDSVSAPGGDCLPSWFIGNRPEADADFNIITFCLKMGELGSVGLSDASHS